MKKTLILFSICSFLCLFGCSFSSGKEVDKDSFLKKIEDLPEHNYSKAKSVVEEEFKNNLESISSKQTNYWLHGPKGSWYLDPNKDQDKGSINGLIGRKASSFDFDYEFDVEIHYYISPFRITSEYQRNSKTTDNEPINGHTKEEYAFNKYGFLTKLNRKTTTVVEAYDGNHETVESMVVKISYS